MYHNALHNLHNNEIEREKEYDGSTCCIIKYRK